MGAKLRITAQARQDLDDIWLNRANYSGPDAADQLLAKVQRKFLLLAQFPESGISRDDLAPALRSSPTQDYLIFYRFLGQTVEIVRILAGRRDIERIFQKDMPLPNVDIMEENE